MVLSSSRVDVYMDLIRSPKQDQKKIWERQAYIVNIRLFLWKTIHAVWFELY